jgi:hypothetical protein
LSFTGRNVFNFREENLKLDHIFGPKLSVFVRYIQDSIPTEEPGGFGTGSNLPGVATTRTNAPGRNLATRATMTVTSRLLNEAGYSYSYGAVLSQPVGLASEALSPDIRPNLLFKNLSGRVPTLNFSDGESLQGFGPYRDLSSNHAAFDSLTWVLGRHTTKYGLAYNHYEKDEGALFRLDNGHFSFLDIGPTGPGFQQEWANFLLGNVVAVVQTNVNPRADILQNQFELFAQDEYRARPNLTLTYGVRWSLFRQPTEGRGHASNFDPLAYNPAAAPEIDINTGALVTGTITPVVNGIIVGGQNSRFGNALARQGNRNVAPRVGFAWDPFRSGKTSVRGGYGIYFDSPGVSPFEGGAMNNPPFIQNVLILNTSLSNPAGTAAFLNPPQQLGAIDVNWRQPYVQQWNLDVQRQLSPTMLFDIGYFGNRA